MNYFEAFISIYFLIILSLLGYYNYFEGFIYCLGLSIVYYLSKISLKLGRYKNE